MVNDDFLSRSRKNIRLINTARGQVVDTPALAKHMQSNKVTGACLDVLEYESASFEALKPSERPEAWQWLISSNRVLRRRTSPAGPSRATRRSRNCWRNGSSTLSHKPMLGLTSVTDYRRLAQRRLPRPFFDYVAGGSYGEVTLRANRADLDALRLRQRVLRDFKNWVDARFDSSATWHDLAWVRNNWSGQFVIKGVLNRADVIAAVDAIVIFNHGDRQLDAAPSTISVLPAIANAVGNRVELLMDGGIRSGQDIVKALAFGARACMVGRAWLYGLAARGGSGVSEVLQILRRELSVTLALLGVSKARDIDGSALYSIA